MSKPSDIITALSNQLKNSSKLDYIDDKLIFVGARESLISFPTVVIEREGLAELEYAYPIARLKMTVVLVVLISCYDKDQQLVGTPEGTPAIRGTLDVENDIKLAIDSDRTLGGAAIHTEILESADGIVEFPVRSITIRLSIWFQQTRAVRT